MTILYDIGAYKGKFTEKMKKDDPTIVSYMFEANPTLRKPRRLKNDHWFNVVLSNKEGLIDFYYRNNTGDSYYKEIDDTNAYTNPDEYEVLSVKTRRLDDFDLPLPDMIKIDTQGSELDILSGCDEILNHCKWVHCEVPASGGIYNYGAPSHEEYVAFFLSHGFTRMKIVQDHIHDDVIVQHDIIFSKE